MSRVPLLLDLEAPISARFDLGRVLRLFKPSVDKPKPPPQAPAAKPAGKPRPQGLKGRNTPETKPEEKSAKARVQPQAHKAKGKAKAPAKADGKAASKATAKAKSKPRAQDAAKTTPTQEASVPNVSAMEVRPHDDGWMLKIPGVSEPAWVVSTKAKAVSAAKDAASFHSAKLSIFTKGGKLQKQIPA